MVDSDEIMNYKAQAQHTYKCMELPTREMVPQNQQREDRDQANTVIQTRVALFLFTYHASKHYGAEDRIPQLKKKKKQ